MVTIEVFNRLVIVPKVIDNATYLCNNRHVTYTFGYCHIWSSPSSLGNLNAPLYPGVERVVRAVGQRKQVTHIRCVMFTQTHTVAGNVWRLLGLDQ